MRIKINCKLQNHIVSTEYRRALISFLKCALINYNKEIFKKYYGNKQEKDFSFSCFFHIDYIKNNLIYLKEKKFHITFSFLDNNEAILFSNAFNNVKDKEFTIFENNFKIIDMVIEKEAEIKNEINCKTLSPIIIRDFNNKYVSLDEEKGKEILINKLNSILKNVDLPNNIEIENINVKKKPIHFYKNVKIISSIGTFTLIGDSKSLDYLYKIGLGSRRKAGFGMIDVI